MPRQPSNVVPTLSHHRILHSDWQSLASKLTKVDLRMCLLCITSPLSSTVIKCQNSRVAPFEAAYIGRVLQRLRRLSVVSGCHVAPKRFLRGCSLEAFLSPPAVKYCQLTKPLHSLLIPQYKNSLQLIRGCSRGIKWSKNVSFKNKK